MRRFAIIIGMLALGTLPSLGQIVTINPSPPPCSGPHCLMQVRGATVPHHGAASVEKAACPQGTIYNPRKGTCRVVSIPGG